MIGEADGEPLTRLTSTGIPPPSINLCCGLTSGEGKEGKEGDERKEMDRCKGEGGGGREEMSDRVKEKEGVHDLASAKTQVKSYSLISADIYSTSCVL